MNNNTSTNILKICARGLEAAERDSINLDNFLDSEFKHDDSLRRSVSSILFAYYRHKGAIDLLISSLSERGKIKPKLRRLLSIVLTQAFYQDGIRPESAANIGVDLAKKLYGVKTAGFVNALARKALKIDMEEYRNSLPDWARLNMPKPVYTRWLKNFGAEKTENIAATLQEQAPLTFRALSGLDKEHAAYIGAKALDLPDWSGDTTFYECRQAGALFKEDWLEKGMIYIQDPSTAMAPMLPDIRGEEKVLDMCAAPGGKSIILSERFPSNFLAASDRSFRRQQLTADNFKNTKINAFAVVASAQAPPFRAKHFSLILIDVPCSNTGVARRRPDTLWNFSEKKLQELVTLQKEIFRSAYELCAPGGRIIYSVCSLEKEEGSDQTKGFLKKYGNLTLEKERLLLPTETHDGAYAAVLKSL